MKEIANQYFTAWNNHDLDTLRNLFHENIVLKDWDIHEIGIENVLKANLNIFNTVPLIKVEILNMAISNNKIMVELKVLLNEHLSMDVVDVLEIHNNLIKSVKAYKC